MRQVTIEKIISNNDVYYRAVKIVSTFKSGEIVKFNTVDGITIAVATVTEDPKCSECVFFDLETCPKFKSNPLQKSCVLCDHHRYGYMGLYFKQIDSILEEL